MNYRSLLEQLGWQEDLIQEVDRLSQAIEKDLPPLWQSSIEGDGLPLASGAASFNVTLEPVASTSLYFRYTSLP